MSKAAPDRRWLFTIAILTGSFLLFLVQPMVARMALPRLGGAPNVWNSAMLVYQALLLAGYAYAHAIGRFPIARQVAIHVAVLLLAAFSLPIALADIAAPASGMEAIWVPWLFLLTVGPAFFAVSAQAPLIQRWYAAHPGAGNPYPLYAASNLGSFAGLLTYPLLLEPRLPTSMQSALWAAGYGVLVVLILAVALSRFNVAPKVAQAEVPEEVATPLGWRRIAFWLALSAIPSGLMLSTTTYLTTDIMAMPLLWVIPLGIYLLSFSVAFSEKGRAAAFIVMIAPVILLVDGAVAMFTAGRADFVAAIASLVLMFVIAVALHARLYADRPAASRLTQFYLVMSAGGVLGGLFAALLAPVLFDWTWEHPILILAAAALVPLDYWKPLLGRVIPDARAQRMSLAVVLTLVFVGGSWIQRLGIQTGWLGLLELTAFALIVVLSIMLAAKRWSFVLAMAAVLLALGGVRQISTSLTGDRARSYFGIYSAGPNDAGNMVLLHGTTVHGMQMSEPGRQREPTSYYVPASGIGIAMAKASELFGPRARVGIVGLGVGTLACYRQEGQDWTFFEIDPLVYDFSERGAFTFMEDCAGDAPVLFGDARLELADMPADSFDLLAIDAFSSDAIPQHLLTREALEIYFNVLADDGVAIFHISNRFVDLRPVLARLAEDGGYTAARRQFVPDSDYTAATPSIWVALSRDPEQIEKLTAGSEWRDLGEPKGGTWTDEYASILPHLIWTNFL
jgi:SAM-dependent methyltransferase